MDTRQRIAIGAAVFALVGGALGGGVAQASSTAGAGSATAATAASAARAPHDCPRTYLCVYPKANFKGKVKKVRQNNRNLAKYGGAFDTPWSAYNNGSSCNVVVYERTNYRGAHYKLNRGTGWKYIGYNLDNIYSNKWVDCR